MSAVTSALAPPRVPATEVELVAALLMRIRAHERDDLSYRVAVLAAVVELGGSSAAMLMRLAR